MLLEHSFVTTRDVGPVMEDTKEMLSSFGFAIEMRDEHSLQVWRGLPNPARAKNPNQLPQKVRVEFDRGRVIVAALIEERNRKFGRFSADMMTALASCLEGMLCEGRSLQEVRAPWDEVQIRIANLVARQKRSNLIAIVILIGIILAIVGVAAWAMIHGS